MYVVNAPSQERVYSFPGMLKDSDRKAPVKGGGKVDHVGVSTA